MNPWLKARFEILKLILKKPVLLIIFGACQAAQWIIDFIPPAKLNIPLSQISTAVPWYGWVIGWLILLWAGSVEYSVKRKVVFDETSIAFFKAYLDFLINEGGKLFDYSADKNFYSRINDWRHKVIQGVAIGLGPEESQKLYQKMDQQNYPAPEDREALALKTNDALCQALQENIEELKLIRVNLADPLKEDGLSSPNEPKRIGGPEA